MNRFAKNGQSSGKPSGGASHGEIPDWHQKKGGKGLTNVHAEIQ